MKILFLLFAFLPVYSFAQQNFTEAHGTLIIAATGKDGIMMAVDSRLTLTKNNKTIGIADSVNKLQNL